MLSPKWVFRESKNFTSGLGILAPPTIPIHHYCSSRTNQRRTSVLDDYSMLMYSGLDACLKHSNLFKVKDPSGAAIHYWITTHTRKTDGRNPSLTRVTTAGQARHIRNPTTSFLTAATLIYAIGAGITAAAGTRLALQWILVKGFKLYSFQLPDLERPGIVIFCHYLPVSGLGNLRACCLPWMW